MEIKRRERAKFGFDEHDFVSLAGLKARGWTDWSIDEFLGEPDDLAVNPHYKCAEPMRLFAVERVIAEMRKFNCRVWFRRYCSQRRFWASWYWRQRCCPRERPRRWIRCWRFVTNSPRL